MARRLFTRTRSTAQLRSMLLAKLEREAEKVLRSMINDFTQQLSGEVQRQFQGAASSLGGGSAGGYAPNLDFAARLFSTGARYLLSRPKTRVSTSETSRSQIADREFRMSSSQMAAEASMNLARGRRNS